MHSETPLARWMKRTKATVAGTARELNISRPRLYHYIHGYAVPTEPVLTRLVALTGLGVDDFKKPGSKTPAVAISDGRGGRAVFRPKVDRRATPDRRGRMSA